MYERLVFRVPTYPRSTLMIDIRWRFIYIRVSLWILPLVSRLSFFFCVYSRYNRGLTVWFYLYRRLIWTWQSRVWKIFGEKLKERWRWHRWKTEATWWKSNDKNSGDRWWSLKRKRWKWSWKRIYEALYLHMLRWNRGARILKNAMEKTLGLSLHKSTYMHLFIDVARLLLSSKTVFYVQIFSCSIDQTKPNT